MHHHNSSRCISHHHITSRLDHCHACRSAKHSLRPAASRVVANTQLFKYQYKYQYLSLKYQYQYPCLKYQFFGSKYQYQYKYLKMVLKYRSSTSTSTLQYYNPGGEPATLRSHCCGRSGQSASRSSLVMATPAGLSTRSSTMASKRPLWSNRWTR